MFKLTNMDILIRANNNDQLAINIINNNNLDDLFGLNIHLYVEDLTTLYRDGNYYACLLLGYAAEYRCDYERAIDFYVTAMKNKIARAYVQLGNFEEDDFKKLIMYYKAIKNGCSMGFTAVAKYYAQQKKYDDAIKYHKLAQEKGNMVSIQILSKYNKQSKSLFYITRSKL